MIQHPDDHSFFSTLTPFKILWAQWNVLHERLWHRRRSVFLMAGSVWRGRGHWRCSASLSALMTPQSESPSFPLIIVDCIHYVKAWYLGGAVGGLSSMAARGCACFSKLIGRRFERQTERRKCLPSALSIVKCIFYELADPLWSRARPRVVVLGRCQAPLPRKPPSSVLMKLTSLC